MSSMTPKMWAKWKDYRLYENPDDLIELFEMLEEQEYVPGSNKTPSKFNPAMIKFMMDGVKSGKYDAMDLIRGIMQGKAGDTSMGVRDMIRVLWNKVDKRFRSYLGGKKRR